MPFMNGPACVFRARFIMTSAGAEHPDGGRGMPRPYATVAEGA